MPNPPFVLPFALAYHKRGWRLVKIGPKNKAPQEAAWNTRTWTEAQVQAEFSGNLNVGVILGEVSDWLVDVDLDCPEAVDLAPEFLPPTLTFGRASARRSHWLYRSMGAATAKFTFPPNETLLELRAQSADGGPSHQTVFPGSIHKDSGEPIEFDDGKGAGSQIAEILAPSLFVAVKQIATAIHNMRFGHDRATAIAIAKREDFSALASKPKTPKQPAPDSAMATAVAKYNADHPLDIPAGGSGQCPICGHKGCWGESKRGPGFWSCFSASHYSGGIEGAGCWTGDALDVDSFEAELSPRAYLIREKYLVEENAASLLRDDKGNPLPSLTNVAAILEGERSGLHLDTFLSQLRHNERQWTDADDLALATRVQSMPGLGRVPLHIIAQGAEAYARRHSRNCVVEFLDSLVWDGQARLEQFFPWAMGAEDNEYTRAVGRNFWRALVARPLHPGCQSDAMVVLEGEQGIRKSSACRVIAGAWFADTDQMPGNKDFCILLQGKLLVELGEMHAFSRAEVTAVKTAVSRRVDTYRAPFGRRSEDHPRQGSLIGTTNQFEWAQDPTGGRRFWPIRCKQIDLDWLVANREQLFAEAVKDVRAGMPWHIMPLEATREEQEARYQAESLEDDVREWLMRNTKTETSTREILRLVCNMEPGQSTPRDDRRIVSIMHRLGWAAKKRKGGGRYWVPTEKWGLEV